MKNSKLKIQSTGSKVKEKPLNKTEQINLAVVKNSLERLVKIDTLTQHHIHSNYYGIVTADDMMINSLLEVGLMELPVVNSKMEIIIGATRIDGLRQLGYQQVMVRVLNDDMVDLEEALIVESNLKRKKSIFHTIREAKYLGRKYSNRQGHRTIEGVTPDGRTRDLIAKEIGLCGTYADWLMKLNLEDPFTKELLIKIDDRDITIAEAKSEWDRNNKEKNSPKEKMKLIQTGDYYPVSDSQTPDSEGKVIKMDCDFNSPDVPYKVYNESCENVDHIEDGSVTLLISSTPYHRKIKYGDDPNQFGLDKSIKEFMGRMLKYITMFLPKIKQNGSICLNINDTMADDGFLENIPFLLVEELKKLGLFLRTTFIWDKINPRPRRCKESFNSHEYVFVFTRTRHHDEYKLRMDQEGDLTSFNWFNDDESETKTYEFDDLGEIQWSNGTVISTAVGKDNHLTKYGIKKTGHPCPMNPWLAIFLILKFSKEGDLIYDPFSGLGTTGYACLRTGRRYVGYENVKKFYNAQMDMLENVHAENLMKENNNNLKNVA